MSLIGLGTTLINIYLPITMLNVSYQETSLVDQSKKAKSNSASSFVGYGVNLRYNLVSKIAVAAHFESVPGVQGKTTLVQGYGISALYSFYGGAAILQENEIFTSVVAPTLNLYGGVGIAQRSFDFRAAQDLSGSLNGTINRGYSKTGELVGASFVFGADYTVLSPQFKITSEVGYIYPLSVSTTIDMSLINARFGVGYQL